MPLIALCPYYQREKNGYTYCESCRLHFKDNTMRRRFIEMFCANEKYSECPICRETNLYYDRKEAGINESYAAEAVI